MKASNEMLLLYSFHQGEAIKKLRGVCFRLGIRVKEIPLEDFHQPLGYLAGVPGLEAAEPTTAPQPFFEPMLVLKNFTSKRIDELLRQWKKVGVPQIPLKAVLTEQNCAWNSMELYGELVKEHQAMQRGQTLHD